VSRDGSVDWLCLPVFDSPSIFNRLLDRFRGGYLRVAPAGADARVLSRRYVERTAVLETVVGGGGGRARVLHFMPALSESDKRGWLLPHWSLLTLVDGLDGEVRFSVTMRPRPKDAQARAGLQARGERAAVCEAHGGLLRLDCSAPVSVREDRADCELVVRAGERACVWLSHTPGPAVEPALKQAPLLLQRTLDYWRTWSGRCRYAGPERAAVVRSALALKLLSFSPSGAIVASPTMGLPERVGGVRNWDYRYCWLRDSAYAAGAFYRLGYRQEADAFVEWLMYATTLTHPGLRVFYDLFGRPRQKERTLRLDGYRGSAPVRRGNRASEQKQLDVYGEVMEALALYHAHGGRVDRAMRGFVRGIGDFVAEHWDLPDHGIWEPRRPPRQYVHSKIMCWHALEQAIRLARRLDMRGDAGRWECCARSVKDAVLTAGWSARLRSFRQTFEEDALDAAVLLLPGTGLLPAGDERVLDTIRAVERRLGCGDGLVRRYDSDDGLPNGEGAFVACSFWLVEALALSGRREQAEGLFARLARLGGEHGLLSEEADCETGAALGNYPQALSHLAQVDAGCALEGTLMDGLED
jgi:GH15 family glucan-1,4-alpha-glucosidase